MLNVTVRNNVKKVTVAVDSETTLRQVLTEAGIDYSRGMTMLDGAPLQTGDMDKTFAQLGITGDAQISNVIKADNA